jgi:hypothetical protein
MKRISPQAYMLLVHDNWLAARPHVAGLMHTKPNVPLTELEFVACIPLSYHHYTTHEGLTRSASDATALPPISIIILHKNVPYSIYRDNAIIVPSLSEKDLCEICVRTVRDRSLRVDHYADG